MSNDDAQETQASGSIGWRHASSGTDLQANVQYVDTERGSPGPFGSDPASRFSGVDTVSRGTTKRVGGGARWMQPWFGAGSRVRQRVEFDTADYDLNFKSQFGESDGNTQRTHARVQTDVAANAAFGFSGGLEWLGESGASTFITAGTAGEIPVERSVLGSLRRGPLERERSRDRHRGRARRAHHRAMRCPAIRSPSQPRPDFPEETINSVNPKIAASFLAATRHAPARLVRHRHPSAGRVRDRVHR